MNKNKTFLFSTAFLLGLSFLTGCTVGPSYKAPVINVPGEWHAPMNAGETQSTDPVSGWWQKFNDSELDSLVERAHEANLDLKIAAARVREARAQYGMTESNFGPAVTGVGTYQRDRFPAALPAGKDTYVAGFDATWELDIFGGTRRQQEAARAEVSAAEFDVRDAEVMLLGEVAKNYIQARSFQQRLKIAQENIEAQKNALSITQQRFNNGLTNNLDVQQAQSLLATTQAQIPTLETQLQVCIHRLGVLLALEPGALESELSASAAIPTAPPEVPVVLPSQLLERRPDVRKAERELAAATAEIGVATADLYPKFSLTGIAVFDSSQFSKWYASGSRFWSAGPVVQWNLFDSGRIRANIRVQNARQEESLNMYEKTVLTAFEDAENVLVTYAKEQTRRQSLQEAVKAAQETLRLANQLYNNGLTNFINVLDAERSLYQAQDALVQSDEAVSVDLVSLYKALGGGWE